MSEVILWGIIESHADAFEVAVEAIMADRRTTDPISLALPPAQALRPRK